MTALRIVAEDERWRELSEYACATHARRMSHAQQFDVRDPARLLALGVISQCIEDLAHRRRKVSLDVPFWARMAEVPEAWIHQVLDDARREDVAA